jgi:hypothetical protein
MPRPNPRFIAWIAVAALLLLAIAALPGLLTRMVEQRVRTMAAELGFDAHWSRLAVRFPGVTIDSLSLVRTGADTLLTVDSVDVTLRVRSLFALRARPERVTLTGATLRAQGSDEAADSLEAALPVEPAEPPAPSARPADPAIRAAADALIRGLLIPARDLPELDLRSVTISAGSTAEPRTLHIETLRLRHTDGGDRGPRSTVEGAGYAWFQREVPFTFDLTYDRSDRLSGHARLGIPDPARGTVEPLTITLDGTLTQHRREGFVSIGDSTRVTIGNIPVRVTGRLARKGPRIGLDLAADSLTATRWRTSVPRPVLGPLLELDIGGAWDQRLTFDLDLAAPDSVRFEPDVIPHDMRLVRTGALDLFSLGGPFRARIHLPKHTTHRDLSPANPHFRPLGAIDSNLVHAVVTNEDGAFFRHGGFNMEAVRQSIAENARAGRFRRGAGTITMQLMRNLYLGHERSLSRKWQEVALAWIVEHLTPVTKQRLLEIYLNIIEWGPGVHGADEATRFYFGHDASNVTPAEALFLATVVPAPSKWKWRLERDGTLRAGTRAQMHFIGRRMIDKGWLRPEDLPPADALTIELLGPARDLMLPAIAVVDDPRFEMSGADTLEAGIPAAGDSAAAVP